MQKTKEELIKEIAILSENNKLAKERDEIVRRNISEFIGSFKKGQYYDNSRDVLVLQWSGIYFQLGKIMADKNRFDELKSLFEKISQLEQQIAEQRKMSESKSL
jgi:hypothetical protein